MKELSIEEKAKAFDGLVERLKDLKFAYRFSPLSDTIEEIFPELRENKDEMIRKELISFFSDLPDSDTFRGIPPSKVIAWLEKQGEKNYKIIKGKNYFCIKTHNYAGIEWIKGTRYYASDDYTLVNQGCECYCPEYSKEEHNNLFEEVKYNGCVEKQGEQKSIDKAKPKFNVGEWITDGYLHYKITDVLEDRYIVDTKYVKRSAILFDYESRYHLWTIQDAKDGDVLATEPIEGYHSPFVAIYKKQNEEDFNSYCFIGFDGKFYKGENGHSTEEIHPATKEQSELLFAKMKEEGYEWNAEKKKLEKIIDKKQIKKNLQDNSFRRMLEQNPAWSEEDEKIAKTIINEFEQCSEWCCANGLTKEDCIAWLKSLRPQNRWKPNEEQIKAFELMIQSWGESGTLSPYDGTMNYLLSLLNDLRKL